MRFLPSEVPLYARRADNAARGAAESRSYRRREAIHEGSAPGLDCTHTAWSGHRHASINLEESKGLGHWCSMSSSLIVCMEVSLGDRLIFSSSNKSEANAVRLYFDAGGVTGRWASGSHEGDASRRGKECVRSSTSTAAPLSTLYPHFRDEDRVRVTTAVDVEGETPVQLSDPAGEPVGDLDPASDPALLRDLPDGMPVSVRTAI